MTDYRVATHPKNGKGAGECFYLGTSPCKAWAAYRKRATLEIIRGERITTLFRRDGFEWEPVARLEP
jgi:hypothetical protein